MVRTAFVKPALPAEAKTDCAKPVTLPGRDLTEKEVATFWGRDRAALVECETRRAAAATAFESETE